MDTTFHQTIANDFVSLHLLMEDASHFLESRGADARMTYLTNLGIEEIVTNIIKYGYDVPGSYQIEVMLRFDGEDLTLVIIDDGHEFNSLLHQKKPPPANVEDIEIGGLGLDLIKKFFDRMAYRREGERNILELTARRSTAKSPS